jgi:hypothetical protein
MCSGSLKPFRPTAIAVGEKGRRLAATAGFDTDGVDAQATLSKTRIKFPQTGKVGNRFLDVVTTTRLNAMALSYLAAEQQLFAIGQTRNAGGSSRLNSYGVVAFCWDVASRALIKEFGVGGWGPSCFRDSCPTFAMLDNEPCILIQERIKEGNVPVKLFIFSGQGCLVAELAEGTLVHTNIPDWVVYLKYDQHIRVWDGKKVTDVATLESDRPPPLSLVKGLTASERKITLVLANEQFVVFNKV